MGAFLANGAWIALVVLATGPVLFLAYLWSPFVLRPAAARVLVFLCGPLCWAYLLWCELRWARARREEDERMAREMLVEADDSREGGIHL